MNLCIFEGRLTRDPELRTAPNSDGTTVNVVAFSIAVNHRNKTSFPNLEAWGQSADLINKWFKKGDLIQVYSELVTDTWTDKETGKPRHKDKYRVDRFDFPPINRGRDKAEEADASPAEAPEAEVATKETPEAAPSPAPTRRPRNVTPAPAPKDDDEDIPF